MTLHPDEQAREFHEHFASTSARTCEFCNRLSALLARVRLAEAEWWHTRVAMAYMCDEQEMRTETRARIDELKRQAAGEWPRIPRCLERNEETGQCELREGHEGKHLAGYLMWAAAAQPGDTGGEHG